MLRPDFSKWKQSEEDVRRLGIEAEHPRSRERFQALYMIGSQRSNATQWAQTIKRNAHTVMEWIHLYNRKGPEAVVYCHSGGRSPLFAQKKECHSSKS